ncbi:hypothetical protein ASPWEDRAFT_41587 [Aspergillus wentii DTO 134E9]|uniref:Copper-fist domain-containing protein n=1 Tax=Aspergillus wentii DTO 134E9 TaxID=1073089 RepID=A0A1L9RFS1_ASPWE|nr:uncharacterized protein ASPWEDRAFT_41587 [Aspergillus wentii DTO 134E9]OJJ33728.1 hypothetical protein ASPWEDRAFT_41587 [Aspergillus wentii DTO 134E9]
MLINGQKWACEACVRGHRVTSCKHHDRPLIQINRKGRPFSTCSVCGCTPCESPEEHAKLKREAEAKAASSSSKKAISSGRCSRPSTGFLPIAPRPVATTAAADNNSLNANANANAVIATASTSAPADKQRLSCRPVEAVGSDGGSGDVYPPLSQSQSFPPFSSIADINLPLSMASPLGDANGGMSFFDPSFAENAFSLQDLDGLPDEAMLQEDWSSQFWLAEDAV